jgi:hypothetical protein
MVHTSMESMRKSRSRSGGGAAGRDSRSSMSRAWRSAVRQSLLASETRWPLSGLRRALNTLRLRAIGGSSGTPSSRGPPSSQ